MDHTLHYEYVEAHVVLKQTKQNMLCPIKLPRLTGHNHVAGHNHVSFESYHVTGPRRKTFFSHEQIDLPAALKNVIKCF